MNIGYISSVIDKKEVAVIATSKEQFAYYSIDDELNTYLEMIFQKFDIVSYYTDNEQHKMTNPLKKDYIHGISFLLPWPYMISKVIYDITDVNKLDTLIRR